MERVGGKDKTLKRFGSEILKAFDPRKNPSTYLEGIVYGLAGAYALKSVAYSNKASMTEKVLGRFRAKEWREEKALLREVEAILKEGTSVSRISQLTGLKRFGIGAGTAAMVSTGGINWMTGLILFPERSLISSLPWFPML